MVVFYQKKRKEFHLIYDIKHKNNLFKNVQLNKQQDNITDRMYKLLLLSEIENSLQVKFM